MSEKMSAYIGGADARDGGGPGNLGGRLDGWHQGREQTPATPAAAEAKPSSSQEALDEAQAGTSDRPPLDDEDRQRYQNFRRLGFSAEEAARQLGLNSAELAELQGEPATKPAAEPTSRAAIESELAKIAALRRNDPNAYWRDERLQQRERELLGAREQLKAEPATASEEAGQPDALAEIEARLKAIRELRSSDPKLYWDDRTQAEEASLLQAREVAKNAASADAHLRGTVDAVLGTVDDATGFESSFNATFDGLSAAAQEAVRSVMSQPALESAQPASEADIKTLQAHGPEGAALVKSWGRAARVKLATAQWRFDHMLSNMDDASADRVESWFRDLSGANKAAVVRALAER
jgi:hypothetical protein